MASITETLGRQKKNGDYPIYIQVISNRKVKRIKLPFSAGKNDVDKSGKRIKNQFIERQVQLEMNTIRERLISLGVMADRMDIDDLVEVLTKAETESFKLDFFEYAERLIAELNDDDRHSTATQYKCACNSFREFLGADRIDINSIRKPLLLRYKDWFLDSHCDCADGGKLSLHNAMKNLAAIHNKAKREFNDDDDDNLAIPYSPFRSIDYSVDKMTRQSAKQKALPEGTIRYIAEIDLSEASRVVRDARDAFMLSFGLCGMNYKDMIVYDGGLEDGHVRYDRAKSARRSGRDAHIEILLQPEIKVYSDRLMGRSRTWCFHDNTKCSLDRECGTFLLKSLYGLGLLSEYVIKHYAEQYGVDEKTAKKELGMPDKLTTYYARHSWATIADRVGVDLMTIDRCLCHSVKGLANEIYVTKSYDFVDVANRKVLDAVFLKKK